ncbi:MAG: hypothetical protein ACRCTZ_14840 [Sarcina sp.]
MTVREFIEELLKIEDQDQEILMNIKKYNSEEDETVSIEAEIEGVWVEESNYDGKKLFINGDAM